MNKGQFIGLVVVIVIEVALAASLAMWAPRTDGWFNFFFVTCVVTLFTPLVYVRTCVDLHQRQDEEQLRRNRERRHKELIDELDGLRRRLSGS